ncbi:MAG TPA: AAA family ATPase, partial [Acidimicrobiia bacterium]
AQFTTLKTLFHRVAHERNLHQVVILGAAGVGKSRLLWEFEKYLDGLVEDTYWHTGRSPSYGDGLTFWALGEMIRRRAGIAENDDDASTRSRLKATLSEFLMDTEERRWIEPRLMALLGLDPMPAGEREELFAALRIFFQRISEHGTSVLVFEDLQWADAGLLDFILDLIERSSSHPVLVITLARPELLERQPGWGGRRNQLSVHLGPLAEAEMKELVVGLAPGIPDQEAGLIADRAAGVPLYAVEMVRMLISTGILATEDGQYRLAGKLSDAPLPDSVQALIGARLDRLPEDAKAVLQEASVIGIVFSPVTLTALIGRESVDDELAKLVAADLIVLEDDPRAPERGQYRFVQGLIREVAYGRLTRAERRSRHLSAARLYEQLDDPELAPVVASHYMSAHRSGQESDDELAVRARTALVVAARRAAELHSDSQAFSLCLQALEMTSDAGEAAAIRVQAAKSADALGQYQVAVDLIRQVLEFHESRGDRAGAYRAASMLADTLCDADRTHEALEILHPLVVGVGGAEGEMEVVSTLARASMMAGREQEALAFADRALLLAERAKEEELVMDLLVTRGTALFGLGRPREGRLVLEGVLDLARRRDAIRIYLRATNNLTVSLVLDDPRAAIAIARASIEQVDRIPAQMTYRALMWAADGNRYEGRLAEAASILDDLQLADAFPVETHWRNSSRALIRLMQGEVEAGSSILTEVDWLLSTGDPQMVSAGHMTMAEYHALTGSWEECFDEAIQAGVDTGSNDANWAYWATVAALWIRDLDRLDKAQTRAAAITAQGRMVEGYKLLGEAGAAAIGGDMTSASTAFRALLEIWEPIAFPLDLAMTRATFAALVGQDDPSAAEAARLARDWIVAAGADQYLDVWKAGLPQPENATI